MNYLNTPTLPEWDKAEARDNWNAVRRVLDTFFSQVVQRTNVAFMKDGSEPMKVVQATLPAGTTYFQGRTRSDTINAYLDAGNWRSWDTARSSWRITQDMANDRLRVERAAATTGNLSWTAYPLQTHNSSIRLSANQSVANGDNPQILFNTLDFEDISGFATLASNGFTAPVTATYELMGALSYAASSSGVCAIQFRNGASQFSPIREAYTFTTGLGISTAVLSTRVRLTAGDIATCYGYQNSGGSVNVLSSDSHFQARLVGYA